MKDPLTYNQILANVKKAQGLLETKPGFPEKDPKQDVGKPEGVDKNGGRAVEGHPEGTNITDKSEAVTVEKLASIAGPLLAKLEAMKVKKAATDEAAKKETPAEKAEGDAEGDAEAAKKAATDEAAKKETPAEKAEGGAEAAEKETPAEKAEGDDEAAKKASAEKVLQAVKSAAAAKAQAKKETPAKKADASEIELTPEFHFKLAHAIVESEEGMAFAEQLLAKKAGAEAAHDLIVAAYEQEELAKTAAADRETIAQAAVNDLISAQDIEAYLADGGKTAAAIQDLQDAEGIEAFLDAATKEAGGMDPAMLEQAMAAQGAGAPPGPAMEGAAPEGGDFSMEDVVEVLSSMLEEGTIDEEGVQAILADIEGSPEMEDGELTEEELGTLLESMIEDGTITPEQLQEIAAAGGGA